MTRHRWALATALVMLAVPSAAAADVQRLSSSGTAIDPVAAFAADGTVRVAWTEAITAGGNISEATLAPGASTLGPAAHVVTGTPFESFPTPAFDGAGLLQVVALRKHAPYPRARYVAQRADGSTTPPITISPKGHSAGIPVLAVARDGSAAAAWRWYDGHTWVMQVALRPAGGAFGAAITLTGAGARGNSGFTPALAVSPGGRVLVTWETTRQVYAATGTTATGLGAGQLLGTFRPNYGPVAAALGDDGRAVVIWEDIAYAGQGGGPTSLHTALAGADGTFAPATGLAIPAGAGMLGDDAPAAAVTADGTALVAVGTAASSHAGAVYAAAAPAGGGFGTLAKVGAVGTYAVSPFLTAGPDGEAMLVYTADHTAPGGKGIVSVVNAARRPAGGRWTAPAALSDPAEEALRPTAALGPGGRAVVAWVQTPSGGGEGNLDATTLAP